MPYSRKSALDQDRLDTVAAEWLSRRDVGLTAAEQREFEAWRTADPGHGAAWRRVESAWQAFDHPARAGFSDVMLRELAARQRRRRWRVLTTTAVGAAAVAAALVFVVRPVLVVPAPPAVTAHAMLKPESRILPDGTVAELNTGAEILVDYRPDRRGIQLVRGEAHFLVKKDPSRPFVVRAGKVNVYAVGTAFSVRLETEGVDVLVTEGKVAVDPSAPAMRPAAATLSVPPPASVFVTAGLHLSVPLETKRGALLQAEPVPEAEVRRLLAWRELRLELSATPLAEAVAVLNRQNRVQITIADADLAQMQLSGVFRADNAEGFVGLLESNYGVTVEHRDEVRILRKAR